MNWQPADPKIWNLLHDVVIVAIRGSVPGDLELDLEADWLPGHPDHLQLHFLQCSLVTFEYCDGGRARSLDEIAKLDLQILNVDGEGRGDTIRVLAVTDSRQYGHLLLRYEAYAFIKSDTTVVTYDELAKKIDAAVDEWKRCQNGPLDAPKL